ncbi:MAG: YqgE/AlgH family protein [Bacteroidia bacterium]|nr:YqgE/AlgH family protein [Bacteroidia bacterium]MDW8158282.1 YqgE/AlgH family protein [Bacteroidia bacterium]
MIELKDWEFVFENPKKPEKGCILIANPFMRDPNFRRSIVFLTEHNEMGSMGFILNKPVDVSLIELSTDFPALDIELFFGGPVQLDTLYFIHRAPDKLQGGIEINEDIYLGGDLEQLRELLLTKTLAPDEYRFFIGYSGWAPMQLAHEIVEYAWIAREVDSKFIFETSPQEMWRLALKTMGSKYAVMANFPEDPQYN